jgi:hypothetical protein
VASNKIVHSSFASDILELVGFVVKHWDNITTRTVLRTEEVSGRESDRRYEESDRR